MASRLVSFGCVAIVLGLASPSHGQVAIAGAAQPARAASSDAAPAATAKPADTAPSDYIIGADDVLSVVFWREDKLSGDVLVRPDGKISVPLLDDVQAAGFTPMQLRDRLVAEARRYVGDPVATVIVKQINSRKVFITGMVVRPGPYPLLPGMTVLQLIATAGGLQDYAKSKDIRVVRVEHGQSANVGFDYQEATKQKKTSQSLELKSGDTVIVP